MSPKKVMLIFHDHESTFDVQSKLINLMSGDLSGIDTPLRNYLRQVQPNTPVDKTMIGLRLHIMRIAKDLSAPEHFTIQPFTDVNRKILTLISDHLGLPMNYGRTPAFLDSIHESKSVSKDLAAYLYGHITRQDVYNCMLVLATAYMFYKLYDSLKNPKPEEDISEFKNKSKKKKNDESFRDWDDD